MAAHRAPVPELGSQVGGANGLMSTRHVGAGRPDRLGEGRLLGRLKRSVELAGGVVWNSQTGPNEDAFAALGLDVRPGSTPS